MHWIRELPKPVGIFACNDDRGQNILEVCKLVGLKVPDDVAVIGVDNDPMICDTGDPPLTSIALNVETAGFEAASLLDQLFRKNKVLLKEIMVTPSHIVQRQSSDILAVDDTEVAKAIHYIKSYAKKKIFIRDIVKTASVSRRTLEKASEKPSTGPSIMKFSRYVLIGYQNYLLKQISPFLKSLLFLILRTASIFPGILRWSRE